MLRFLRRAAFTAAVGGVLYAAVTAPPSESFPVSSSPSNEGTGHLALVRAHPGLRELNALLTPGAFFVDATQALLAGALRCVPYHRSVLRQGLDYLPGQIMSAESEGNAELYVLRLAQLYARDGRLEDALDACAWVAERCPHYAIPRIYASGFCHMLGRLEEAAWWLEPVPERSSLKVQLLFTEAVLSATLGCAPRAVAGAEELVLVTTLGMAEMAMWSIFKDGDLLERLQVLAFMAFLRRAVAKSLENTAPDQGPHDAVPS